MLEVGELKQQATKAKAKDLRQQAAGVEKLRQKAAKAEKLRQYAA